MDKETKKATVLARRNELANYGARKELAAELNVSTKTIGRWLRKPDVPTVPSKRTDVRLDDPHWVPAVDMLKLIAQYTGDASLAAFDLTDAVAREKVACMRRHKPTGVREPVPTTYWADYKIIVSLSEGLSVVPRRGGTYNHRWVYFVWQPHIAKLWPAQTRVEDKPDKPDKPDK